MTREKLEHLRKIFEKRDRVGIFIIPDPDSIACAMAMHALIRPWVAHSETVHLTEIHRSDNRMMLRLLKISFTPYQQVDLDTFTRLIMVDGQPNFHPFSRKLSFDVIIDHHPDTLPQPVSFSDIRPSYGAASTIMTEYLLAGDIRITPRLATALYYAIKTDTDMFRRISSRNHNDINIICHLIPKIKLEILRLIEGSEIPRKALKRLATALEEVTFHHNLAYVHLGEIQSDDLSTILADFLLRVKGTHWSIVSFIMRDHLVAVMRSWKERKNVGKLAARIFRHMGGGGGGHRFAARAEMPMENIPPDNVAEGSEGMKKFTLECLTSCYRGRNHGSENHED